VDEWGLYRKDTKIWFWDEEGGKELKANSMQDGAGKKRRLIFLCGICGSFGGKMFPTESACS